MSDTAPNKKTPPESLEGYVTNGPFQVAAAVIVGLIVLLATRGLASVLVSAAGTYLALFYISRRWLAQKPHPDVSEGAQDQAMLTTSITTSYRSAYAISSNWLSLWQGSTFRYYLHLDAAMSLVAYSSSHYSPLERYSTDEADQQKFFDDGLALVKQVASADHPWPKHRLRFLIYPEWVYDRYGDEILHLIKSHSAARIPCIPLLSEKLDTLLTAQEKRDMEHLVKELGQNALDKMPPLPVASNWRSERAIKKGKSRTYWPPLFPDMLLIDSLLDISTSAAWWYANDGHVQKWSHLEENLRNANTAFRTICRYVDQAMWSNYAPRNIGGVALSSTPDTLYSEAFFARAHYDKWLKWIRDNARSNQSAAQLKTWLDQETAAIDEFVDEYAAKHTKPAGEKIEILDVGCGFGRHLISVLKRNEGLAGTGVDINYRMVAEATRQAKREGLHRRAHFMVDDAATLEQCKPGEFDLIICTTNTLGNLSGPKREALMTRLRHLLSSGGQVLISVYSSGSVAPRMESYRAIDLHAEERGTRIVATEGLESEAFTEASIRTLLEGNDMRVVGRSKILRSVGFVTVAERR
jgi:SAM-dependent methyltransferase